MGKKQYDPLWEIVDEKIALQDQEEAVDLPCPYCHVPLRLGPTAEDGWRVACGLCGGVSRVGHAAGMPCLEPVD